MVPLCIRVTHRPHKSKQLQLTFQNEQRIKGRHVKGVILRFLKVSLAYQRRVHSLATVRLLVSDH